MTKAAREQLQRSLNMIAEAAPLFKDPWHLIGSAAAHIAGADVSDVNDIDLLLSTDDIHTLKAHWQDLHAEPPAPSNQFRSAIFYRFQTPLPIEAMTNFELKTPDGEWLKIEPRTRVQYGDLYAPDIAEQIDILRCMSREKDKPRIEALNELL